MPSVWISLLVYNSDIEQVRHCIRSVLNQQGIDTLKLIVSDNASLNNPLPELGEFSNACEFVRHPYNLGFCGGHNWVIKRFLESDAEFFVTLNPDLKLEDNAIASLVADLANHPNAATAAPLLLRAQQNLEPYKPEIIDAAGMLINSSLRHFDRFAECKLSEVKLQSEYVFGASGACLIMRREFIKKALLEALPEDADLQLVYPELWQSRSDRAMLFDEAFFAYREDADLAWRARNLGWGCRFVANAVGYHVRQVTPERRAQLPSELNRLGVRNRFLLQGNNTLRMPALIDLLSGYILRNLIVIFAVLLCERSSIKGLLEAKVLMRRARAHAAAMRKHIAKEIK